MTQKFKNWTDHHTHRVFHMVMLTHTLFMVGIILSALCILAWRVQGETVSISATVEAINETPTIIEPNTGGGSSSVLPSVPNQEPSLTPEETTLDNNTPAVDVLVESDEPEDQLLEDSKNKTIRVPGVGNVALYHTVRPTFSGRTNIPFAIIYLEIHSIIIKANTQADAEGNWSWSSTENLEQGLHKIYVTSVHPEDSSIKARSEYSFYVTAPSAGKSTVPQNIPDVGNNGTLFDVFVSIPTQFKKIAAGEDIVARVRLVNFGKAGSPVDVGVQYIIENSSGEVIRQSSETVAVATQISLLKTFLTSPTLEPGKYRFIVRVPSKDLIATAFEAFEVSDVQVIPVGDGRLDYTVLFQTLLAMILLFSLIGYFEYNKVVALSDRIRQADEFDLSSQLK